jgi:hypothetical protein
VSGELVRHALHAPTWTRRNRWGLLALPFALVAALAASSDRVKLYFWDEGLHQPHRAVQGAWLDFRDTYSDSDGEHPLEVKVRLDGVREAIALWQSPSPLELPAGARAVEVELSLEADPKLPLSTCKLAVRDAGGTRYEYLTDIGGAQPFSPCVPPDAPGPQRALGDLDKGRDTSDEPARPPVWTVKPVITLPAGVEVSDVVLWWDLPDYAELAVSS